MQQKIARGRRFNEAAAHSPRKPAARRSISPTTSCFNEAAAHSPRKPQQATDRAHPQHASMRPRRIRRGNGVGAVYGERVALRFNEAAAHSPRKRAAAVTPLFGNASFNEAAAHSPRKLADLHAAQRRAAASMRPRRIRRGNLREPLWLSPRGSASMRPRRIRRGNWPGTHAPGTAPRASMRPRRIRRGNGASAAPRSRPSLRFNEAAAHCKRPAEAVLTV